MMGNSRAMLVTIRSVPTTYAMERKCIYFSQFIWKKVLRAGETQVSESSAFA